MELTNEIEIRASWERIFALAAATERWPSILPHYRFVRRLRGDDAHKLVEMAAWRDLYPVRWTAVQRNLPDERRITFRHVRGVSRGMEVEWRLTPTPAGTHVLIWHEFNSNIPIAGDFFARRIVGDLFVSNIAGKTLRRFKEIAERDSSPSAPVEASFGPLGPPAN
jgi:Polyketide cyclase / dehydrase and lipid transport